MLQSRISKKKIVCVKLYENIHCELCVNVTWFTNTAVFSTESFFTLASVVLPGSFETVSVIQTWIRTARVWANVTNVGFDVLQIFFDFRLRAVSTLLCVAFNTGYRIFHFAEKSQNPSPKFNAASSIHDRNCSNFIIDYLSNSLASNMPKNVLRH